MKWVEALKIYNSGKGLWCIPRKGSPAYAEVLAIMKGGTGTSGGGSGGASSPGPKKSPALISKKPPKMDFTPSGPSTPLTSEQDANLKKILRGPLGNIYREFLASMVDFTAPITPHLIFLKHIANFSPDLSPAEFRKKVSELGKLYLSQNPEKYEY